MRFGICAPFQQVGSLADAPIDYLEEHVQRFLMPEQPYSDFAPLLKQARSLTIPIEAANSFIPAHLPLIETPTRPIDRARIAQYVQIALQRAEEVGIRVIVFGSGKARACPPDYQQQPALYQLAEHLTIWSQWATQHGIQIVLEPLRYAETNILNTVAESIDFVETIAKSGTRLLADIYHMTANREDPRTLYAATPLLTHAHIAEHQERAAPGRHGDNFLPYLSVLQQIGYDQRISVECRWYDLASEVPLAIKTVREQWNATLSLSPKVNPSEEQRV